MKGVEQVRHRGLGLVERQTGRVLEFVAFHFPPEGAFVVGWPAAPGAIRHDVQGLSGLLHFAPARWLAPSPCREIAALVAAAEDAATGTCIDVTGKWREFALIGTAAARVLASTLNTEIVLEGRECAAVTLFDCPCVLARVGDGYRIWVRASFAEDFVNAIESLCLPG